MLLDLDAASAAGIERTAAERRYGAPLRFSPQRVPYLVTNFVGSIDGAVSLGLHDGSDVASISGRSPADRFVMGMLRSAADVIVVGARTLADSPGHQWTPAAVARGFKDELLDYRLALGRTPAPAPLVIVSASGMLPSHVALTAPAVHTAVLTTNAAAPVARDFPQVDRVVVEGGGRIDGATLLRTVAREFSARVVLCEGGPALMGSFVAADQVSELFVTVAPRLVGRDDASRPTAADDASGRRGMVEGYAAPPDSLPDYSLLSVRREAGTLLLRYRRS